MRTPVLLDEIRIEREGIVLGWAPLASIALHVLAIALLLHLSWREPRREAPREEPRIQFTFQPIEPLRVPGGGGAAGPAGGRPAGRPSGASAKRASPSEPPRSEPVSKPPPANDMREPPVASAPSPPPQEGPGEMASARPRSAGFSLDRALRDFRHSLDEAPATPGEVPGGAGAGGAGGGGGLAIPDLPPLPPSGFGFGNLQFESRDFDWTDYARQIYVAIWRAWHNRLYLTTDAFEKWAYQKRSSLLDHQSAIRFTIERNGQVVGVAIETASGCEPLDDSAVHALEEVVLPPLPSAFPRDRETIHARFIAQGEIRSLRPTLTYLRQQGFF